jgi:hypothetical protein
MQETEVTTEQVKKKVSDYLDQVSSFNGVGSGLNRHQEELLANPDTRSHVVNIGTSILCTRWDVGPAGGGFVQAVVNNDLMGAYGRADSINREFIGFYCGLIYNVGM